MEYDIDRARQAVQFLVDSSYFAHHIKRLRNEVLKPRALPFKDEAECLNELLVIGRQKLEAMENLIGIAEYKRDDRNDYQRQYMAQKRRRERKVYALDELLAGRSFTLDERNASLHRQYAQWNAEKDRYLASLGELSWHDKNEHTKHFWDTKEVELDELIKLAKEGAAKTVTRKRVVVVPTEPAGDLGKKLKQALAQRVNNMHRKGKLSIDSR